MKKILFLLSLTILFSCSFNQTFSNRESDKNDALKITGKFYWEMLYGGNKDKMYDLFSENFFQITSKDQLDEMILSAQQESGAIKEYNLAHWETLVIKGSDAKSQYLLVYDVIRESGKTEETFSMLKEDGIIKIVGYRINHILKK